MSPRDARSVAAIRYLLPARNGAALKRLAEELADDQRAGSLPRRGGPQARRDLCGTRPVGSKLYRLEARWASRATS